VADRVLVTGGAGFIGSHTIDALQRDGASVRVLDRLHPQVHPDGVARHLANDVELITGDVRDLDTVRHALVGVTHVLHLAAETSVGRSLYEGDHHVDVNARGTAVLFRAIRESGAPVEAVVLSSSRAVYGEGRHWCATCGNCNPGPRRLEDLLAERWRHRCPVCGCALLAVPTDEQTETRSASSYGLTKGFQEQICALEAAQLGVPVVALRYFNVYGPRQSPHNPYTGLITTLGLRLLGGRPIILYEQGTPVRDFVHVDDVVSANLLALRDPPQDGPVNIGTGRSVSLEELVEALAGAFGVEPDVQHSSRFRVGDIHAAVADTTRARDALAFTAAVSLEDGLATVVDGLRDHVLSDRSDAVEQELRERGVLFG
jgi:dTDP-L-rhamnose 4-epimerase